MAVALRSLHFIHHRLLSSPPPLNHLFPPIRNLVSISKFSSLRLSPRPRTSLSSNHGRFLKIRRFTVTCAATQHSSTVIDVSPLDTRVPVTVITGFLGSGKTTLLNYVLNAQHGKRIAVIENEFGEVDIDGSLVADQRREGEDIMMLNNGCLCCTVRGDLVRMITELVTKKRDKFDHIVIETTGLANPAPIIQTFFLEDKIADNCKLDGLVTLVDAKHAPYHLDQVKPDGIVNEAVEQIAYADRIILNKIDLVDESELQNLTSRIREINSMARLQRAKFGLVDLDYVLGIGGFDLERVESEIKEPAHDHNHHEHDHKCDANCNHDHEHDHHHEHKHEHSQAVHAHDHTHDPGISSVSIVCDGSLDLDKINNWLGLLLEEHNEDIYRMKGVLSIDGLNERFVFQGVHAFFSGSPNKPWQPDEKRTNKIVFIGKDLDKEALQKGFKQCIV